jgi:hypothetical protein
MVQIRFDVRQVMLEFFRQVFRIPNPAAGLAGARGLVVPQFAVQGFDQLDAFAQRIGQLFVGLVAAMDEILQAFVPAAIAGTVTGMAALTGGLVETLVRVVSTFDELPDENSGIRKRFY